MSLRMLCFAVVLLLGLIKNGVTGDDGIILSSALIIIGTVSQWRT